MKDSGIEWIGEIPEEWEVRRIKIISTCRENKLADNSGTDYFALENIVSWNGSYIHTDSIYDTTGVIICKTGDIAFGKLRPYLAKVFQIEHDRCCSSEFAVFGDFLGFSRYYFYIMLTNGFVNSVDLSTYGVKMPRANIDYIKNMFVPIPSYNEQQHISGYLDRQCTHIDNIIEKTKTSIEEYKKLKQAVITQAVTKGIRGNREMKDSGIEWIGEIPVEWEITRIKNYCKLITGGTPSTNNQLWFNGDIEWFTPGDFLDNYWLENSKRKLSQKALEEQVAVYVKKGTVLIVGIGATAGKVGITAKDSSFNQQITALVSESINSKYLLYWLEINKGFIRETANYTTLPIINNQTLGQYVLIIPRNKDEQQEIAAYLEQKCTEIDAIITKKQQFLTEMENYKKSLIFECVTGKREVFQKL